MIPEFSFSLHAKEQMELRGISEEVVWETIRRKDQVLAELPDKDIYQSRFKDSEGNESLIRVFVNRIKTPKLIITVYKTSKVSKYWKNESEV